MSSPSDTLPSDPNFINTGSYGDFEAMLQKIRAELEALIHGHKAGEALNMVVEKLMPLIQKYNLDYVQGNIANGESAAAYALKITNYISEKFADVNDALKDNDPARAQQDAKDALGALHELQTCVNAHPSEFGSMGTSVIQQLLSACHGKDIGYDPNKAPTQAQINALATDWTNDWTMTNKNSGGINANGPIMQAFSAAQNQSQSAAAYLQSEEKLANQNYQKYAATQHSVAENIINTIKAATTASKSTGN